MRVDGGELIPFELQGSEALVTALLRHQVGRLALRQLTPARDLLELSCLLTSPANDPQGGLTIEEAAASARLWNIELVALASLDSAPVTSSLPQELLLSLRDGAEYATAESALAKLATRGEQALTEGDARTVGAVLVAMDAFERQSLHDDLRHTCELAMKRLLSPMALKLTAQLLPAARQRFSLLAVLGRMEDEGAAALFAHLVASQSMNERRTYFDAIVELHAGVPMLVAALEDPQWYVARNAAELLGAMRIEGTEAALVPMLRNADERRRAAAASALARLRTPDALAALHGATSDPSPQVRYFAQSALIARIEGASARQLGEALDQNADGEMKLQIIAALGRLGTPDAIQKLIKQLTSTAPGRGMVDMTSEFRCASIEAVAKARGRAALSIISQFRRDRDPQVRDTAQRIYVRLAG
ncbi:MAG: HEAT repeat domain-containing protein [Gemmatimonadota bacterium]